MNRRRALLCAPYMPAFDRESGSQRIFDILSFLRESGWSLTFVADDGSDGQRYARILRQSGVEVYFGPRSRLAGDEYLPHLHDLLKTAQFDLALLFFWPIAECYAGVIRECSPRTRIIVDSVDLHFLRNARRLLRKDDLGLVVGRLDGGYAAELVREINAYVAADAVLTVSQKEADLLNDLVNDPTLCFAVPDVEEEPPCAVPIAERKGIVFIGNFRHPPNIEAVEFLSQAVLPQLSPNILRKHPVYVVGNAADDRVRSLVSGVGHVHLVGWVPSVLPYLQRARVSVVPLLHGAGTKRKLLQALLAGTPSVSTSIGIEGLGLRDGEHVLVADDPTAFALSIERLVNDVDLSERLAAQARAHVSVRHGRDLVRSCLDSVVSAVLTREPRRIAQVMV